MNDFRQSSILENRTARLLLHISFKVFVSTFTKVCMHGMASIRSLPTDEEQHLAEACYLMFFMYILLYFSRRESDPADFLWKRRIKFF